jgi:hypothetical protein
MSKTGICAVIALTTALAGAAYADPPGRGGGGGGGGVGIRGGGGAPHAFGGGGGGAPHAMGGGARFGGGGAPHAMGGGARFGGGGVPHAMGGGARFGGGAPHAIGGGARFSGGAPHAMRGGARFGGGGHFGGVRAGGGARFGGAPHVGGARIGSRPAISRFAGRPGSHPSVRGQRSFADHGIPNRGASRGAALNENRAAALGRDRTASFGQNRSGSLRSSAVRNALNSNAVAGALHNRTALLNPNTRAQIAASAATAGWRDGRGGRDGWWRHRHGGYGWVGPLFWPFAYYDLYDYTLWGYGYDDPFWDYGYNDIYAGLFAPYGYDELLGYLPPSGSGPRVSGSSGPRVKAGRARAARAAMPDQLAQLCGDDSRDIAGLPIDEIQQAIQPNEAQRAALDDLANASVKAAQDIRAACPKQIALTAPARLAAMQERIEAMISAVGTVHPALQKFYDLLNDEQRARLNALSQNQGKRDAAPNPNASLAQGCGATQSGVTDWPTAELEARLHPTEAQAASLTALKDASALAADMLKNCPATEAITPPARLEAIANRLDTMLQAVKTVRAALDDFYGKLTDEQKAQFEAIGPRRSAHLDEPTGSTQQSAARTHVRRHHASFHGIIRHLMSMARW